MKTLTKEDAIVMNYDERDEAGPPGKADMEAPKGTGNTINTIMNDTPDVVSRYENKLDDEIIEDQNLISRKLERRKHLSGNLSISSDLHLELYLQWEHTGSGLTRLSKPNSTSGSQQRYGNFSESDWAGDNMGF